MLSRLWRAIASRRRVSDMAANEPVDLASRLQGFQGKWVAVKDGEVVAAAETMDRLLLTLHESQRGPAVRNATILRVPAEHEAELVGLG
jgi:hypothetical protein